MKNYPPPIFFDKSYNCSDDSEKEGGGDWIPQNCLSSAHKEVRRGPHVGLVTQSSLIISTQGRDSELEREQEPGRNSGGIIYTRLAS